MTRKARDAATASAQAYPGLRYPLGQHIRHADKTDGAAGSHCSRLDGRHFMPEEEEWAVIELLVDILKPFQWATEAMGGVHSVQ